MTGPLRSRLSMPSRGLTPMRWPEESAPRRLMRRAPHAPCCSCWVSLMRWTRSNCGPTSNPWLLAVVGLLHEPWGGPGACPGRQGLRGMPTIAGLFREGRLSYSKVREVTRVVDVVDEHRLVGLALTATASQLARMISGFRTADGMRIKQQTKRSLSWHERDDGMIDFRIRLPKEEGAVLMAAIDAAKDQFGPPPPKPDPCGEQSESAPGVGTYSRVDALLDVARGFLDTAPEDRSGEDRTLVVVNVSSENLARI